MVTAHLFYNGWRIRIVIQIVEKQINKCPGIGVSTPSGCMMEPTDVGGDSYRAEVITQRIDNSEVPGFRDQYDEDRKQNDDMVITSLRWETHRSGELTDTLANNTEEATHP